MSKRIYLDHAATTPMREEAKAAMVDALTRWANPSSPHAEGRAARAALEEARGRIKRALGWAGEVIFTSGATEAIAIALHGRGGGHVTVSTVEHDAVLRAADGCARLRVGADGRVDLDDLAASVGPATQVVAVQSANNESGVLQPIDDIAALIRSKGAGRPIRLLCDCVQTAGKLALPEADMIALSAHKLGGPPGIGALLVRDLAALKATGGQERGYRPGTENLPAILGFAAALEATRPWIDSASELRRHLEARLTGASAEIVAAGAPRIPTIGAYRMVGVSAATQLIHFDMRGISVSAGSACSSGSLRPSHVLSAMGWDAEAVGEVVRVSFGPQTRREEVDAFVDAWVDLAERKRAA